MKFIKFLFSLSHRPKHRSEHVVAMKICCDLWSWKIEKEVLESPGKVLEFFLAHDVRTLQCGACATCRSWVSGIRPQSFTAVLINLVVVPHDSSDHRLSKKSWILGF